MTYDPAEERFHLYALRGGENLEIVATCGDPESVGLALVTLHSEGEFVGASVGILEKTDPDQSGCWVVNPYGANLPPKRFPRLGDTPDTPQADI